LGRSRTWRRCSTTDVKRRRVYWNVESGVAGTSGQNPAWSPDGKRLAFDTRCEPNPSRTCSIFVSAPDGAHARRIAVNASEPAWSPDGRQISFVRVLGQENSEIYVMNADGSHQRRLTFNKGPDVDPDWQPVH
jgi:TolB protein